MERLTKRLSSGAPTYNYPASCYFGDDSGPDRIAQSAFRQRCVERLADYEDTGRTPEEVTALGNLFDYALEESKTLTEQLALLNRIRELAEADKNGCVIIVPCKVGDTVYFALLGKIIEKQVFSIVAFSNSTRIYCGGTSEYFRPEDIGKPSFLPARRLRKHWRR